MLSAELEHLELLAEVDSLVEELKGWSAAAPDWPAARDAQALIARLAERSRTLRIRLEAPLVVATLGGTGTGKSSLVNALVGSEVSTAGRQRPTTRRPTYIGRPGFGPAALGIDPETVHVVERDLPALRELILIDCPDPDTTEEAGAGSNLERLRALVPFCDVLLVTSTQQKYRSARVAGELAAAAPGARLVFVQTHADADDDIREDWRAILSEHYAVADIFFVDSLAALADARAGVQPRGDFGRLLDLLTRQLADCGASRIRRANFLELVSGGLTTCRQRIDQAMPAVEQLESAVGEQRERLAGKLAARVREELLASRRPWEQRLLGEIAGRWGLSPFSLVLRAYQGLGRLLSGAALLRVRTPAQLALWGAFEAGREWKRRKSEATLDNLPERVVAWGWEDADLRTAAIILDGYADEAGVPRDDTSPEKLSQQAAQAGASFIDSASQQLQALLGRLAQRHSGWFTRMLYEVLLSVALIYLAVRWGTNFFYDSWWKGAPLYGLDFFVNAALMLLAWSAILLWMYSLRLRSGVSEEIEGLVEGWTNASTCSAVFAGLERRTREIRQHRERLARVEHRVSGLRSRLAEPAPRLGHRIAPV
jgi:hypothetical protein